MSAEWGASDLARLLALEHAFSALAVISAGNFAHNHNMMTREAVKVFRQAIESSVQDTAQLGVAKPLVVGHLKSMFDHVALMAEMTDQGPVD